jgi:hypothetical protein
MPYTYNNIQFQHVDETNTAFQTAASYTAATIPALTDIFAIGNRVKMTLTIDASGAETFASKLLRINPAMFLGSPNNSSILLNASQFGFESNGVLTTTVTTAVLNAPSQTQNNFECEMSCNAGFTTATVVIYFYVTNDLNRYLGNQPNATVLNINRLIATAPSGIFTNNNPNTVYRVTKNMGFVSLVFDYIGFSENVIEPVGASPYLNIPMQVRWFNTDSPLTDCRGVTAFD